jgi:hypothetical protein
MSRSLLANHNPCRPTNKVTPSHQTGKFLKCDDTQSKGTVPVQLAMQDIVNTLKKECILEVVAYYELVTFKILPLTDKN